MLWIGLTGSIGSGKSTVANMLRKHGFYVVNADVIAHEGLRSGSPSFTSIIKKFGSQLLDPDGEINRRELGKLIFVDQQKKEWLENLLHPMVQAKVQSVKEKLISQGHKIGFYEVPLLFEKGLESQFDKIVVVHVNKENQFDRLKKRNSWTDEEIAQRNASQVDVAKKVKSADFVIDNNGNLEELQLQVDDLVKKLENLASLP